MSQQTNLPFFKAISLHMQCLNKYGVVYENYFLNAANEFIEQNLLQNESNGGFNTLLDKNARNQSSQPMSQRIPLAMPRQLSQSLSQGHLTPMTKKANKQEPVPNEVLLDMNLADNVDGIVNKHETKDQKEKYIKYLQESMQGLEKIYS